VQAAKELTPNGAPATQTGATLGAEIVIRKPKAGEADTASD